MTSISKKTSPKMIAATATPIGRYSASRSSYSSRVSISASKEPRFRLVAQPISSGRRPRGARLGHALAGELLVHGAGALRQSRRRLASLALRAHSRVGDPPQPTTLIDETLESNENGLRGTRAGSDGAGRWAGLYMLRGVPTPSPGSWGDRSVASHRLGRESLRQSHGGLGLTQDDRNRHTAGSRQAPAQSS